MKVFGYVLALVLIAFVTWVGSLFTILSTNELSSMRPLLYTIWYIALLLIVAMTVRDFVVRWRPYAKRILMFGSLGAVAVYGVTYTYYSYIEGIRVEERGFELAEYQPFQSSKLLAQLDEEVDVPYLFKEGEPRLDGSTALYPLYAAFVQELYRGNGTYSPYDTASSKVVSTTTGEAYERLLRGETDLVFMPAPSAKQLESAQKADVSLEQVPVGREGFVFFVHEENPVDSLTLEQVMAIYAGEIRNWKDVAGSNQKIRAFQRPEGSGSQTALERMMGDRPLMEAPTEDVPEGMGGIIEQASAYRNHENAIGFSFRYYATEMISDHNIKLLKINGVAPTVETIQDRTYPLTSEFYAVTTSEKADVYRPFLEWMDSEEAQTLVERTGYVRLK